MILAIQIAAMILGSSVFAWIIIAQDKAFKENFNDEA